MVRKHEEGSMSGPIVKTGAGALRGREIADGVSDGVKEFLGIPYGASTGGAGRFRAPQPVEPWTGVRDALELGPVSPQYPIPAYAPVYAQPGSSEDFTKVRGNEDCLVLNVWTPATDDKRRPVMFWMHGGAFLMLEGSTPVGTTHGDRLAVRQDVVVVTVNHRLGPFGYLFLGDILGEGYESSGVLGMLDIIQALEWVRDNIAGFGGDPLNVTLFGESGGGMKASVLLTMPSAQALFHRAIIQSGAGVAMMSREEGTMAAEHLLSALHLLREDARRLHALAVEDIIAPTPSMGIGGLRPVVDGRYLPQLPFDPVAAPTAAGIPIMIGTCKHESSMGTPPGSLDESESRKRVSQLVGEPSANTIIEAYRSAYPGIDPTELFVAIASEQSRLASARLAERHMEASGAAVYSFTFAIADPTGRSPHAIDIPFPFDTVDRGGSVGDNPVKFDLARRVSTAWASFARTGDPNHGGLPKWPTYSTDERSTMILDADCHVEPDMPAAIRAAWLAAEDQSV
jgi:para-nitrobenzyl esterase